MTREEQHEQDVPDLDWALQRWGHRQRPHHGHRLSVVGPEHPSGGLPDVDQVIHLVRSLRRETIVGKLQEIGEQLSRIEARLAASSRTYLLPIQHLDDARLVLAQPILVNVEEFDQGYLCYWGECNLNASGDTELEALENFKDILTTTFMRWIHAPAKKLGPAPTRHLRILKSFIELREGGRD